MRSVVVGFSRLAAMFALCLGFVISDSSVAQDSANGQCFRTPVRSGLAKVAEVQPVRSTVQYFVENKPVRSGLAATFGVQRVSSLSACGCGCGLAGCNCQQSSFQVGGYDTDGALITSIGAQSASVQSVQSTEVSLLGIRKRRASREVILEAANKAHDACTISSDELKAIRLACMSPRMLSKMEDLIIAKAQASGAYVFRLDSNGDVVKSAIDWEAIADFIVKIAPIIFKLIELFVYAEQTGDIELMFAVLDQLNFIATHSFAFSAC